MTREERIDKLRRNLSYTAPELWRERFEDFYDDIQTVILNALESHLNDVFNTPSQVKHCMTKIKKIMDK